MNPPRESLIAHLRNRYNYHEAFDLVLATQIDEPIAIDQKSLYTALATALEGLDKRVFVPCRDSSPVWHDRELSEIVRQIIIPSADLVIAVVQEQSTEIGMMVERARQAQRQTMLLYPEAMTGEPFGRPLAEVIR